MSVQCYTSQSSPQHRYKLEQSDDKIRSTKMTAETKRNEDKQKLPKTKTKTRSRHTHRRRALLVSVTVVPSHAMAFSGRSLLLAGLRRQSISRAGLLGRSLLLAGLLRQSLVLPRLLRRSLLLAGLLRQSISRAGVLG